MTIAIYIVEGTTQLVLTPESDWEKNVTRQFAEEHATAKILKGSFYECAGGGGDLGGWYREGCNDESLILRLDKPVPKP